MKRWWCRTSAYNGGDIAGVLEGLAEPQVEVAVWDGGETQTGLCGVVEVGAHGGEVDERHSGRIVDQLALREAWTETEEIRGRRSGGRSR